MHLLTRIINNIGPTNAHIVPDLVESQQLRTKEKLETSSTIHGMPHTNSKNLCAKQIVLCHRQVLANLMEMHTYKSSVP